MNGSRSPQRWVKKGLVAALDGRSSWARHSAITPTPYLLDPETIRVFAGFRDDDGVSRIGFVDLDAADPARVKRVSETPALDVGKPGTFDDNGVILGDILEHDGKLLLYYVGFQLVRQAKFLAFSGLATSSNAGESFSRLSDAPVLDRADEGLYIRAIHSVRIEAGVWKVWYAAGAAWTIIGGVPFPNYHIRYLESADGRTFGKLGEVCVEQEGSEYRIGRPRVYLRNGRYEMYYTRGTVAGEYVAGMAVSDDGRHWSRRDDELGIGPSRAGWDSEALSYPSLVSVGTRTFMFYNGNDMGRAGFGWAELEEGPG